MNVLDTNVWLYSRDPADPIKQRTAQHLVQSTRPLYLPWQVGCEFIAGSRKLVPHGLSLDKAWAALDDMQAMADAVLLPALTLWAETKDLQAKYSLSFWDALLVATCIQANVRTLYTEDMGSPRVIGGLSLVNPFVP